MLSLDEFQAKFDLEDNIDQQGGTHICYRATRVDGTACYAKKVPKTRDHITNWGIRENRTENNWGRKYEIHHPFLVTPSERYMVNNELLYVYDFVAKGDLLDAINNGEIQHIDQAKLIFTDLCAIVADLHAANCVHMVSYSAHIPK